MNKKIYDVIIVGGGVIGCSIARYLSRYKVNGLLIEKHSDVGEETSCANSAIVHSGYDPLPNTRKAYFNVKGNKMMEEVCKELHVPFIKNGSLTIGFNEEDRKTIENLFSRAKSNGVDARIVEKEELHEMEPSLNDECLCALYCKDSGIVSPFELTIGFMENAMDNGFELNLNEKVEKIIKNNELFEVITNKGEYLSKTLVNAAGLYSDEILSNLEKPSFKINARKGEYILLDHFNNDWCKHTLFMCPTKVGKGVLISPTTSFNYIIGPSNDYSSKEDTSTDTSTISILKETAAKLIKNIPYSEVIRTFAGTRPNPDTDDFIIEESKENPLFFNVGGIMSPGLASSPAIGEYVSNLIKEKLNLSENLDYNPIRREVFKLTSLGKDKYNELIKKDPTYGHIICRCEKVSEGEIIDSIHRNCGARTIKGVKKRLRAGFGKCQGCFCQEEVLKILARELNVDINQIRYKDEGSEILKYPSKGE